MVAVFSAAYGVNPSSWKFSISSIRL